MERMAYIFREIATRTGLPEMKTLIRQPGVKAAYRVTVYYHNFRASDSVATVTQRIQQEPLLEVVYAGHFEHKPLSRTIAAVQYERFCAVFQNIRFDKLIDQQNVSPYGVDLMMVERAAGGFVKGIIFAPTHAEGAYATLYNAIHAYIPEALREVK